jgi:23S rRNA pseudouridine1911/1915/1917 synthase
MSNSSSDETSRLFRQRFTIYRRDEGRRLDRFLADALPDFSRSFLQRVIRDGGVRVNDEQVKPAQALKRRDTVDIKVELDTGPLVTAEDIPLDILYEDEHLLAINKPPDMVVHPAKGHQQGTLVNALLGHTQTLSSRYGDLRAGIVHRLDRDTSGVILVAKTDRDHAALAEQFQQRSVEKHYLAVVEREPELDADRIEAPLAPNRRSRGPRQTMTVRADGKPAATIYRVRRRFRGFAELAVQILTGRTHQIRVHLVHIGHPVVADADYGTRDALYRSDLLGRKPSEDEEPLIDRQALHAHRIAIHHPATGERMEFVAPPPPDITALLTALEELRGR